MADVRISSLEQLTGVGAVADVDELVVVDKSDTSMAGTGTDKRITALDLSAAVFERRPVGLDTILQSSLARGDLCGAFPNGNSTTLTYLRMALTATGTVTAANVGVSTPHTRAKRVEYLVTTPSSTAVAGFRTGAAQFTVGDGAGNGGFLYVCRWAPATGQANASNRAWCGLRASVAAPTDVNPSTLANVVGMGWDSADAQVQMMCNDGVNPSTKIALGPSFVRSYSDRAKVYELAMFAPAGALNVSWRVTELTAGVAATGTIASDLPSPSTLLMPVTYCSVGGVSSVVGVALMTLYIETDL